MEKITKMNIDTIRKLLCSENEDDNLLALNIIRGRNMSNWGEFLRELEEICHGYFYTSNVDIEYPTHRFAIGLQVHLWDKYFDTLSRCEMKAHWYTQID